MKTMTNLEAARATFSGTPLDSLLQDPLIRLMMASDGVADADIRHLARRVVASRAGRPAPHLNRCAGQA